jgi:hypothetical protein
MAASYEATTCNNWADGLAAHAGVAQIDNTGTWFTTLPRAAGFNPLWAMRERGAHATVSASVLIR